MKSVLCSVQEFKFNFVLFIKFLITASILVTCLGCGQEYSTNSVDKSAVEPAPSQTKTNQLDIAKVIVGYWVTETGQLKISPIQGRIFEYDWYAIKSVSDEKVVITWDDGLNCSKTEGQIAGNTIKLMAGNVKTELVVRDSHHATITFRDGQAVYVKQLVKQREDATVICN